MKNKDKLRKKFFKIRAKNYFIINSDKFNKLISYIKKIY